MDAGNRYTSTPLFIRPCMRPTARCSLLAARLDVTYLYEYIHICLRLMEYNMHVFISLSLARNNNAKICIMYYYVLCIIWTHVCCTCLHVNEFLRDSHPALLRTFS